MRSGRMTEGQQRGLDQGWPKFGLQREDGLRDFDQVFGRSAPRTFEIGFGMGHATLEMAAAAPEQDFIGVEVHKPGVGALLNGMLTQNLSNIRVYRASPSWCAASSRSAASCTWPPIGSHMRNICWR
jgi:tRNA (guanine-N7-)-methyltransferase